MSTLPERIRIIRTESQSKKLSMATFAAKIKASPAAVSQWETGDRKPSDLTIHLISTEFGINEDWLRTGKGDMKAPMNELDEIANITRELFGNDPDSSKAKLARFVFSLEEDEMEALIKIWKKALEFIGEIEKDR